MKNIQLLKTKNFYILNNNIKEDNLELINNYNLCLYLKLKKEYSIFSIKDILLLSNNSVIKIFFNDFYKTIELKCDNKIDKKILLNSKFDLISYNTRIKMKKNKYVKLKNYFNKNKII